MDTIFAKVAGLDVHQKFITVGVRCRLEIGKLFAEVRESGTMTRDLLALADYLEAFAWYRNRSERAASRFEEAIEKALCLIADAPEQRPLYDDRHRFYLLKRYPYSIVYRMKNGDVLVVAVAHARRRANYWKDRQ